MSLSSDNNTYDILIDGNDLNIEVKDYFEDILTNYDSREDIINKLTKFKTFLLTVIDEINSATLAPRNDNLTKENILVDLQYNLSRVNETLANMTRTAGRRKSRGRRSRGRRKSRRSRKTLRRKSLRRRRH
jgi:hypothetical protein